MADVLLNYWAILVATIIQILLGMFWYSPIGFGKPWMKSLGKTLADIEAQKGKGMALSYIFMIITAFIMTYVLAHFVDYANATDAMGGLVAGFWIWLGFIATSSLGMVLWEKRSLSWYAITSGYYLVSLLITGAVLAVWV